MKQQRRKAHFESSTPAFPFTERGYRSSMQLHKMPHDGQTKPKTTTLRASAALDEPIENPRKKLWLDA